MPSLYRTALNANLNDQAGNSSNDPMEGARTGNIVVDVAEGIRRRIPGQTYPTRQQEYPPENILAAGPIADVQKEQASTAAAQAQQQQQAQQAQGDAEIQRQIAEDTARLQKAQADAKLAEAKAAEATSPETQQANQLALQKANLDIQVAQLNIAKLTDPNQSPAATARLEAQLKMENDRLNQEFQSSMQDARIKSEWDKTVYESNTAWDRQTEQLKASKQLSDDQIASRESISSADRASSEGIHAADRLFQHEEGQLTRDFTERQSALQRESELQKTRLQAGVQLRGQEVDRLQAIDTFTTNTIANQIRKGELDVDRGYKVMQAALQAHRMPSEIVANIGQGLAPFIPNLSSYKKGDIPLGFESGGPFETALRQGGATSYDPNQYAANPVGVDLFGIAKKFGATNPGKLPNPESVIPKVSGINTNPVSALANAPSLAMPAGMEDFIKSNLSQLATNTGQPQGQPTQ